MNHQTMVINLADPDRGSCVAIDGAPHKIRLVSVLMIRRNAIFPLRNNGQVLKTFPSHKARSF